MTYNDIKERISNLNSKEKQLLFYLVENDLYRFTPVEISRVLGVTNKTVINRLKALCINGFVVPKLVNERIRSYELSALTRSKTKSLRELLEVGKTTSNIYSDVLPDYRIVADILEELIVENYSSYELLEEFKKRIQRYKRDVTRILIETKSNSTMDVDKEKISYERIQESSDRNYKTSIWDAAIGLQAVDGLKASKYLKKLAEDNISGRKSYDDISRELKKEYGTSKSKQQEADIVALRIAILLEQSEFFMSADLLLSIHEYLFNDVLENDLVGSFRNYKIRKREPILLGDSVKYSDHLSIKRCLKTILEEEKQYKYSVPMTAKDIDHLSWFTSKIWQIHPFGEGNTRTTAVFIELYLKLMGYDVNNKPFRNNSDYFRNALVRSCYSSDTYSVNPSNQYLNLFYENLLLGADNILDSFDLFISNN